MVYDIHGVLLKMNGDGHKINKNRKKLQVNL